MKYSHKYSKSHVLRVHRQQQQFSEMSQSINYGSADDTSVLDVLSPGEVNPVKPIEKLMTPVADTTISSPACLTASVAVKSLDVETVQVVYIKEPEPTTVLNIKFELPEQKPYEITLPQQKSTSESAFIQEKANSVSFYSLILVQSHQCMQY